MAEDVRYQAAVDAAIRVVELFNTPPGEAKARLIGRITFLLLESLYDTERRLGG